MEKIRKNVEYDYHVLENEDDVTTKSEIDILKIEHGEKEKTGKSAVKVSFMKVDKYSHHMQRCDQTLSFEGGAF